MLRKLPNFYRHSDLLPGPRSSILDQSTAETLYSQFWFEGIFVYYEISVDLKRNSKSPIQSLPVNDKNISSDIERANEFCRFFASHQIVATRYLAKFSNFRLRREFSRQFGNCQEDTLSLKKATHMILLTTVLSVTAFFLWSFRKGNKETFVWILHY